MGKVDGTIVIRFSRRACSREEGHFFFSAQFEEKGRKKPLALEEIPLTRFCSGKNRFHCKNIPTQQSCSC